MELYLTSNFALLVYNTLFDPVLAVSNYQPIFNSLNYIGKESHLQNTVYNTVPLVIHANGPTKLFLNTLGNYIPKSWNSEEGCLNCWEDMNSLEKKKVNNF